MRPARRFRFWPSLPHRRSWNEAAWSNPDWDAKLNAALSVADAAKRKEMMKDIEQVLQDSGIIIPAYWRKLFRPLGQGGAELQDAPDL